MKYRPGGEEISHPEYFDTHADILNRERWIIDGFGCVPSAWERFAAADTLVYLDLPLMIHGWWVTKRLLTGVFKNPEGWPEDSPILRGSLNSYRVLWLCHRKLTPAYRQLVSESDTFKSVYHLKTSSDISGFLSVGF